MSKVVKVDWPVSNYFHFVVPFETVYQRLRPYSGVFLDLYGFRYGFRVEDGSQKFTLRRRAKKYVVCFNR